MLSQLEEDEVLHPHVQGFEFRSASKKKKKKKKIYHARQRRDADPPNTFWPQKSTRPTRAGLLDKNVRTSYLKELTRSPMSEEGGGRRPETAVKATGRGRGACPS